VKVIAKTQQNRDFAKVGKKTTFTYYRKAIKVKLKTKYYGTERTKNNE
jgi:hypothetical protein